MSSEFQDSKDAAGKLSRRSGVGEGTSEPQQGRQMEAFGKLAGTMAHDFNNILAAALMQLAILRQSPELTNETKASIRAVEAELTRAANLTRQLILFNPQHASKTQPLDLKALGYGADSSGSAKAKPHARDSEQIRGGSESILLVDDDLALRRMTALCLRKLGYAVFEAANVTEGLNLWNQRKQTIGLLFTDMMLPEAMSGLELAQRINRERPGLPVIISTGYSVELAASDSLAGQARLLSKPYTPATLATVVRQCLDNAPSQKDTK